MQTNHPALGRTIGQVLHPSHHFLSGIAPFGEGNPLVDKIGFMGQEFLIEINPEPRLPRFQTNQILREPTGRPRVFNGGHGGPEFAYGVCTNEDFKPLMGGFVDQQDRFRSILHCSQPRGQCLSRFWPVQAHRTPRRLDEFHIFAEDERINGLDRVPNEASIRSQDKVVRSAQHAKIVFHPTFPAGSKTVSNLAFFHVANLLGQQPLQEIFGVRPDHLNASPLGLIHHGHPTAKCGVLQFDGIKHGHHWRGIIALPPADPMRLRPAHTVTFRRSGPFHLWHRLSASLFRPLAPSLVEVEERILTCVGGWVGLVGVHTFHGMPAQPEVSSRAAKPKPD